MTYLSAKTSRRKTYTKYMVLAGMFLLIVFFFPVIKKHTYSFFEPVVVRYVGVKNLFTFFPEFFTTYTTSRHALVERDKRLEIEIERLENLVAEKDALLRESGYDIKGTSSEKFLSNTSLVAYPLMQDIIKLYSTILLSKGFKDGVAIGDMVYVRGNQAVCTIKEIYTSSSLCLLLSSSSVETEGVTASSSITLQLVGRGGYYLANVARDTNVVVGEKVYLRSDPKMVLGTVKKVANNNQDTSWHVFVEGAYNPVTSSIFYVQQKASH